MQLVTSAITAPPYLLLGEGGGASFGILPPVICRPCRMTQDESESDRKWSGGGGGGSKSSEGRKTRKVTANALTS